MSGDVCVYSFPRYSKIHETLMDFRRQAGAKIILMTDRLYRALAAKADVVIVAQIKGWALSTPTLPHCISEVLILAVCTEAMTPELIVCTD